MLFIYVLLLQKEKPDTVIYDCVESLYNSAFAFVMALYISASFAEEAFIGKPTTHSFSSNSGLLLKKNYKRFS